MKKALSLDGAFYFIVHASEKFAYDGSLLVFARSDADSTNQYGKERAQKTCEITSKAIFI
jgi:hypothetical protein